ncbi:MAG: hypothetical protein P8Y18_00310 [Candidatus Bathyarchaeota archaeon]
MHPHTKTYNPKDVLRNLPNNEQFHFFINTHYYTGKSARNLNQFCKILNTINEKSIDFHLNRYDFERWTGGTLHDPTLARRINKLKKSLTEEKISEQKVRILIHKIAKNRLKELKDRRSNK